MKSLAEERQLRSRLLGRLLVVLCVFVGWGFCISARLVYLQIWRGPHYQNQAQLQQQGYIELNPRRGDILDRNLQEMAVSVRADTVFAQPPRITDPATVARRLSPILTLPEAEVLAKLKEKSNFVYLKRRVPVELANAVRELKLPGIGTMEEMDRVYPGQSLASHVLGIVGSEGKGLEGTEFFYEKELNGEKTRIDLRLDAKRKSFDREVPTSRSRGNNLQLTIDRTIQHVTESVLRQTVQEAGALDGSAIVMNPQTGEILALASWPDFDPNQYGQFPGPNRKNRSIHEIYEPGSTFKVVTLSALLEEGLVFPDELIDCRAGTARLGGKVYREAKNSFQFLTVAEVIAKSSNVGTVKMSVRLGPERMHQWVARLGFGRRSGVDLPGEETGLLRPTSQWSKLSIGAMSIGQEVGVTPLQMIRAVAAIANGGYLVRPFVVRRVISPDGDTIFENSVEREQVLKPETTRVAKEILSMAVAKGTGTKAALKGYSTAGKTGTAQKIVDGRYSTSKHVGSFVGFAPVDNPALIALVVINEPKGIYYGGYVAAPAFKQIMERALIHMGVPQDQPIDVPPPGMDMARRGRSEGQAGAATAEATFQEEEYPVGQLPTSLVALVEGAEAKAADSEPVATVAKVSGPVLPDFTGRSLRDVARECARLGITLRISGSGSAVGQRPSAGESVTEGMVCEVFFAHEEKTKDATARIVLRRSGAPGTQAALQ